MNPNIIEHFDTCEVKLIESPAIVSYQILSREIAAFDGKLPNAPHHVHSKTDSVKEAMQVPDVFFVISEIEKALEEKV